MPRVGVLYDYTKEGRSKVYSHVGRYLDTESQSAVLASTGIEYEIVEDVAIRAGFTRRRGRNGGDIQARSRMRWLRGAVHYRYERGPPTHRIDSTLEVRLLDCIGGRASLPPNPLDRRPCSELWLGAVVREGGDPGETRGSGLALSWQLRNELAIGLEATRTREDGAGGALQLDWGW